MKMLLKDIVNPKKTDTENGLLLPQDTLIDRIDPEEIPETVNRVCAVDREGHCTGNIDARRLLAVINSRKECPLNFVLNELDEAVIAVDRYGMVFYLNEAYSKILGVPPGKIIGRDLHVIEETAKLLDVLATGQTITEGVRYIKSVEKYVVSKMFPIIKGQTTIGAVSVFRDMTGETKLNDELQRMSQVAEEYNQTIKGHAFMAENHVIGESRALENCIIRAMSAAVTDATILIRGESGTGKEVFTRMIHEHSKRKDKPFIAMNCAAIPENLIESELFGYESGAFTGASKGGKLGKIQLAEGGTLFLDEIGDMPLQMQTKLLRVLQEGEIDKIGSKEPVKVDFRLIAATNRPLEKMIEEGTFRQDLFYRLNVVSIEIPPLRKRGYDITLLAGYFLQKYNQKHQKDVKISTEVYHAFQEYHWPGNIRELQNVVESCVVLCQGNLIVLEDLPETIRKHGIPPESGADPERQDYPDSLKGAVACCEKEVIERALKKCSYDRNETIRLLNVSRRTFYRKIEELGISLK